jgi:acetyl-CoA carboxylase alpha subunit
MENVVQQALEGNLLRAAKTMEDAVDAQLHRLENLEEDDLERIRQKRIDEMKK